MDVDAAGRGVSHHVAHQLAQHPGQARPLHHRQHDVGVMHRCPLQFDAGGGQSLADVGLPFGQRVRQRLARRCQPASQCLQILQGVPRIVLHLGRLGLVHQRQQPGADVVVQILSEPATLFAATLLHRLVERDGAPKLFADAVGQPRIVGGEQPPPLLRVTQQDRRRRTPLSRVADHGHRHQHRGAVAQRVSLGGRLVEKGHLDGIEYLVEQPRQGRSGLTGLGFDFAGGAEQLLEQALGAHHARTEHAVDQPLARAGVDRQRQEQRQCQRCELTQREQADEQQIEHGCEGADDGEQRQLAQHAA